MNILIIGGYGNFGKRLVDSLVSEYDYQITIAGRSINKANAYAEALFQQYRKKIHTLVVDIFKTDLVELFNQLTIDIVVNASGPYQLQSASTQRGYTVAYACINANCHYVDLADNREFVVDFEKELDALAKQNNLSLITGASTVPGLSAAVISAYIDQFTTINSVDYGISPGNKTERGEATVGSILSYVGKPFVTKINGAKKTIYGWQNLRRHDFGKPLGKRWMSNCDVPDLDLLPLHFPQINSIRFQAGLEVSLLHVGLWLLSWFSRFNLIKNWEKYTKLLTKSSEYLMFLGSDAGGMYVRISGNDDKGKKEINWQLVAEDGVGPNVPSISAEIIIAKIAAGQIPAGAMPCIGWFDLTEFEAIAKRWGIFFSVDGGLARGKIEPII